MDQASALSMASMLCAIACVPPHVAGHPPWPDGAPAALSLTFDDGDATHLSLGAPLLDERGVRGTFYLVPDWVDDVPAWQAVAERGHEIGSHSLTHPDLRDLSQEALERELVDSRDALQQTLGVVVEHFAYPFAAADDRVVAAAAEVYRSARLGPVDGSPLNGTAADRHRLASRAPVSDTGAGELLDDLDAAIAGGSWLVVMVHAIDHGPGWEPVPRAIYAGLLDEALAQDVWVAPVGEVVDHLDGL